MISSQTDTIVAPISGTPPSGVAVVRLSGPDAYRIASSVFTPWPAQVEPRKAIYGNFSHGDDGLLLPFPSGQSFTGDETVEMSIHGSQASIQGLLTACLKEGARMAKAGEFTQRAFLNGRLDLTQAEAVADLIDAQTELQLKAATRIREGALGLKIRDLIEQTLKLMAYVDAHTDFSEELGDLDHTWLESESQRLHQETSSLLKNGRSAAINRKGLRIAIIGQPNAGKSSLLNALLGSDRAIVTEIPGTTRDYVEESADFDGVKVVLIDTAGLRETSDPIESIGVQRSRAIAANADRIWYVYDATIGWTNLDQQILETFNSPVQILANKAELSAPTAGTPVSAKTGAGLKELVSEIARHARNSLETPYLNDRQDPLVERAANTFADLNLQCKALAPEDLLAVLLQDALFSLREVIGEEPGEDMITEIFSRFCIGK